MSYTNHGQGVAFSRSLLTVTSKYRPVLLAVLIVFIALGTVAASASYLQLKSKVRELSALEPVKLLAVSKELQVGDVITDDVLVPMFLFRHEYDLARESYVLESSRHELIGRVVKVPLLARSFIRQEHLAELGSLPGLVNLIERAHSLLDVNVPQQGFNVYIRPDDKVDLYEVKNDHSELIAAQVKVILVDSQPMGRAPLRVTIDPRLERQLTLAVPDQALQRALKAKQARTLMATYRQGPVLQATSVVPVRARTFKATVNPVVAEAREFFQTLVFIKGDDREVLGR